MATMFLARITPCTRLAGHSLCLGRLTGSTSRIVPTAYAPTFQQCAARALSKHSHVNQFGKFVFDGPGNVYVAPLSAEEYPNMDQCTISCDGDDTRWSVTAEGDTCSITSASKEHSTDTWSVCLPIKYDVEVRSAGSVALSAMECSRVSVKARDDVTLTAVKAGHVTVHTEAAVRVSKLLLGNVSLEAEEVDSSGARLQGQTVAVSARSWCHLSDIYADTARLEVRSADLRVGTVHADTTVTTTGAGEVVIGGLDGSIQLSAPSAASVRCHIARLSSDSRLRCGGVLHVTLAPGVGCRLEVRGPPADLDPRLGTLSGSGGGGGGTVTVAGGGPLLVLESPQPARVRVQDWAAAVAGWS